MKQINNPDGFNAFKKKAKPTKTTIITTKLTDLELKDKIRETFRKQWLLKREVLVLSHELRKYQNMLLGLDDLEEQLKEKYGE